MPSKDYYVILGIPPDESEAGIKSAYRDLARRYHPDRAGPESTRRFQELAEAYTVLSDRARRSAYDAGRRRSAVEPVDVPVSGSRSGSPIEPLDDSAPASMSWSIMDDFMSAYASRDAVFDRFVRSFTEVSRPKARRVDTLNLGIHMTRDEARRGAEVAFAVPVFEPCRRCHGSGRVGLYACPSCRQSGWFESEEPVTLRIPPMVRDGDHFIRTGPVDPEHFIVVTFAGHFHHGLTWGFVFCRRVIGQL